MQKKFLTGFTLVELLVVIVILGFLMALLMPALQAARRKSHAMGCASNLRQLGLAMSAYTADFGGYYPYGVYPPPTNAGTLNLPGFVPDDQRLPWPRNLILNGYVDSYSIYYCPATGQKPPTFGSFGAGRWEDIRDPTNADANFGDVGYAMNYCLVADLAHEDPRLSVVVGGETRLLPVAVENILGDNAKILMIEAVRKTLSNTSSYGDTPEPPGPKYYYSTRADYSIPDYSWQMINFPHPGQRTNALFCDYHVDSLSMKSGLGVVNNSDAPVDVIIPGLISITRTLAAWEATGFTADPQYPTPTDAGNDFYRWAPLVDLPRQMLDE